MAAKRRGRITAPVGSAAPAKRSRASRTLGLICRKAPTIYDKKPPKLKLDDEVFPLAIPLSFLRLNEACCCCLLDFTEEEEIATTTTQSTDQTEGGAIDSSSLPFESLADDIAALETDVGVTADNGTTHGATLEEFESRPMKGIRIRVGALNQDSLPENDVRSDNAVESLPLPTAEELQPVQPTDSGGAGDWVTVRKPYRTVEEVGSWISLLQCCSHTFHFECISRWCVRENTCPQCKKRFTVIGTYDRTGVRLRVKWVKKVDQKQTQWQDSVRNSAGGIEDTTSVEGDMDLSPCFMCHGRRVDDEDLVQCYGNRGRCCETAHMHCLKFDEDQQNESLVDPWAGAEQDAASPFLFFCPTCIRQQQCVTVEGARMLDSRSVLAAFPLPTVLEEPTDTLTLRDGMPKLLREMYAFIAHNRVRNSRTTRQTQARTAQARTNRRANRRQRRRNLRISRQLTAAISEQERRLQAEMETLTAQISSSQMEEIPCPPPVTTTTTPSRIRRGLIPDDDLLSGTIQEEQRHAPPTPPPQVCDEPTLFESYQRRVMGRESYGMSRFASRVQDGGTQSGREFLSDLLPAGLTGMEAPPPSRHVEQSFQEEEMQNILLSLGLPYRPPQSAYKASVKSHRSRPANANPGHVNHTNEATLLPLTHATSENEQSISEPSYRQEGSLPASEVTLDRGTSTPFDSSAQSTSSIRHNNAYSTSTRPTTFRRVKPTRELVNVVRPFLGPVRHDREAFRTICKCVCDCLTRRFQAALLPLMDQAPEAVHTSLKWFWRRNTPAVEETCTRILTLWGYTAEDTMAERYELVTLGSVEDNTPEFFRSSTSCSTLD